jgi:hypothetical protein
MSKTWGLQESLYYRGQKIGIRTRFDKVMLGGNHRGFGVPGVDYDNFSTALRNVLDA